MPIYDSIVFEDEALKIQAVPYRKSKVDSLNEFSRVFHEDIEIKCFYKGSSTLCVGTENITVQAGDVVFINPYEFHCTVENGAEPGEYFLLMIGLDFFESIPFCDLRYLFIQERTRIQNLIRGNKRISRLVIDAVLELAGKKDRYENVLKGIILELTSLLLRDFRDTRPLDYPTGKRIRNYQTVYPAIRLIRQDCTCEHSIDELARACGVSKYHFCRIFKDCMTVSAVEYRNEYRLQTADVMLKTTDSTIAEISVLCGFDDPAYFSRCYKNKYGISPQKNRAILSK